MDDGETIEFVVNRRQLPIDVLQRLQVVTQAQGFGGGQLLRQPPITMFGGKERALGWREVVPVGQAMQPIARPCANLDQTATMGDESAKFADR